MRKIINFTIISAAIVFIPASIYAAHTNFTAYLTGDQQAPAPVTTNARGTGAFTLTSSGGLKYVVSVNGLSGAITGAHFHLGSVKEAGPVVFDITGSFIGNNAVGSWTSIPDSLIAALLTGRIYVNVHTAANPNGEIRGQLNLSAGTVLIARFDGTQEIPSVSTPAKGMASIVLTSPGGVGLAYAISVNGLSGAITGAHFHYGFAGQVGPVVYDVTSSFAGTINASGVWRTSPAGNLVDSLILALLTGRIYLNVHTAANPGGEIRGQVILSSGFGFQSRMTGADEVPPVSTTARGTASYTLTDYGLVYSVTCNGLSGGITGAHFHNADSGATGPVIFDISSAFVNNSAKGIWRIGTALPNLTGEMLKELFNRKLYINVHTASNPNGEIRGMLNLKTGTGITAQLDGFNEVPPITTNAKGTASLNTVPAGLAYEISVVGLSGSITGAHFHFGSIRDVGPVVKDITSIFVGNNAAGVWGTSDPQPFNDSLRAALVAGKIYLNVHTASNPGGEIRGQVFLSAGSGMQTFLTGVQEVPPVSTTARGTSSYTLTRAGLGFNVSVNGLSGAITGAHFHLGGIGIAGPVVKNITPNIVGNNITGYWRTGPPDPEPLVDSLMKALMNGRIYLNIHTAANPGGEIRGQVYLSEGLGLTIQLAGSEEVPPVTTNAKGSGSATITDGGLVVYGSFNGLSGMISGIHFHNAPAGANGPVVRDLGPDLVLGNNVVGVWRRTDAQALTNAFIGEALTNSLYLNVHTAANPNGEIRGQLKTGNIVPIGIQPISSEVPGEFRLSQNYPNPFNPATTIRFDIPFTSDVKLIVYDILGRKISTLVEEQLKAGIYEVKVGSLNMPSGVYFYKIETKGFSDTKKMIVVK